ncbi:hypothetical protein MTR_7g057240 [Medicago truncatula]|uniref:Peroxidase n=1 Tax=Medicago truncatula TaxID=3880 RepID=G7L176_MEDTR|nr:hypothetical protein MTR_7g057240 [Medicago truncatula]
MLLKSKCLPPKSHLQIQSIIDPTMVLDGSTPIDLDNMYYKRLKKEQPWFINFRSNVENGGSQGEIREHCSVVNFN